MFREQEMLDALSEWIEEIWRRREGYIYNNVLVVHDEQENLDAVRRILRKRYNVFEAVSGRRALEILASEKIEVIIVAAFEALRAARWVGPLTPAMRDDPAEPMLLQDRRAQ